MNTYIKTYSKRTMQKPVCLDSIVSIGYSIIDDGNSYINRPTGLKNFQLIVVRRGSMLLYDKSGNFTKYDEGTVIIFAPGATQRYTHLYEPVNENYWVHFENADDILRNIHLFPEKVIVAKINLSDKIFSYWLDIITELQISTPTAEISANLRFYQLLVLISNEINKLKTPKDNQSFAKLTPAIIEMNNKISENHSMSYYASLCYLSESAFFHLFSRVIKTTPKKYLNDIRLKVSEDMLKETNLSIENIAVSVGFSTVQYFSKVFKEKNHCSPGQFRKNRV